MSAPRAGGLDADAAHGWAARREAMVVRQIEQRGVRNAAVLATMRAVPRHEFVPERERNQACDDHPLPIGFNQTISQPYIVAAMTEALDVGPYDAVLEIGTGSGYQTAVLSKVAGRVYSVEIVSELATRAKETLVRLMCANVEVRTGDGYAGWPEHAPYEGVIVTCAPEAIPPPLLDQMAEGGRMVIPVGGGAGWGQNLVRVKKTCGALVPETLMSVVFVPMTGLAQQQSAARNNQG